MSVEPDPHRKRVKHYHKPDDLHELTFSCYRRLKLLTNNPWKHRLLVIACLLGLGCSPGPQAIPVSDDASRMESVVRTAISKATVPLHRDLLERGEVFVDIEDLDVPCVGVQVPLPNSEKRGFLSFTKGWFHAHTIDDVAAALLHDLGGVLADLKEDETESGGQNETLTPSDRNPKR